MDSQCGAMLKNDRRTDSVNGDPAWTQKTAALCELHVSWRKDGDCRPRWRRATEPKQSTRESGALNQSWYKRGGTLYALKNAGQSSCLLDAVSLFVWGVSDSDAVLRNALYNTMARTCPTDLRLAWHGERSPQGQRLISSTEDWKRAMKLADPRAGRAASVDNTSQRIHLFLLANILRRAVVVLGDSRETALGSGSSTGPVGIYLPLLWESADCHPYPVVLGSTCPWKHFVALVTAGSVQGQDEEAALPLVRGPAHRLQQLPLRFTPDREEVTHHRCLRAYMKLRPMSLGPHTAYAARLKGHNLPEALSLVQDYFRLAHHMSSQLAQEEAELRDSHGNKRNGALPLPKLSSSSSSSSSADAFSITRHKCATERCLYFSSKHTWPLCHGCHGNLQQQQGRQVEGRGYSSQEDSLRRDTPPRVQPTSGPSSAPSPALSRPSSSHNAKEDLRPQQRHPGGHGGRLLAGSGSEVPLQDPLVHPGEDWAEESDFLSPVPGLALHPPTDMTRAPGGEDPFEGGQRCRTPGCVYFGTPKHAGYCTVCYCSQNQMSPQPPPQPAPTSTSTTPSSSSSSSSSSSLPLQLSSTLRNLPRCSGLGCAMLGNPSFRGLCERCFLSRHRGTIEPRNTGDSSAVMQERNPQSRYHWPLTKQDLPREGVNKVAALVESRRSPIDSSGNSQALAQTDRPRPCLGIGCTNYGNSRCRGFCNSCYRNKVG
ncbi:hypothetical protein AGOR_G00102860 [Albula goreensis]|uniref:ubiquitinyl hydrolase 1 n=1 Tax=Albula goreensis TaxID=1534307 RepID=A0A8T3DGZ0_9TELE|nr:hypothetical protein AGOR_G00102860 [Albula goreensis]